MSMLSNIRSLFVPPLRMAGTAGAGQAFARGARRQEFRRHRPQVRRDVGRCRHADLQGRPLPFERVRPLRLWRRRLHGDAVRRDDRVRSRDREPAVRQAALERRGARAAPRRHDDDDPRRPGHGREVGPGRGKELSGPGPSPSEADMSTSSPGTPDPAYHEGMRQLQDRCDTRQLADRLDEKLSRTAFTADDRAFIESRPLFFLATADASGRSGLFLQGRRARVRPGDGRRRAGVSELRRQRHVPQPRQRPRQPGGGLAVHRLRAAQSPARQRRRPCRRRAIRCWRAIRGRSSSCACTRRESFRTARATSIA